MSELPHRGRGIGNMLGNAERFGVKAFFRAVASRPVHLLAFLTLCAAYIQGGVDKLIDIPGALNEMRALGLPQPSVFLPAVIVTELVGSVMVIIGWYRWFGALWLAGFTFIANLMANAFWALHGADRMPNENAFFEHWGLIGGFLLVAWIDVHDRKLGTFDGAPKDTRPNRGIGLGNGGAE